MTAALLAVAAALAVLLGLAAALVVVAAARNRGDDGRALGHPTLHRTRQ